MQQGFNYNALHRDRNACFCGGASFCTGVKKALTSNVVNHACLMVYLSLSRAVHTPLLLVQTPLWPTYFNNIIFMDHTVVKILELLDRKYMYIMKDGVERNFSVPGLCCLNGE